MGDDTILAILFEATTVASGIFVPILNLKII